MFRTLWIKFLILLFAVSIVALSSAFFLRGLIIKDFNAYLEGEMEDRLSWVIADVEGTFERKGVGQTLCRSGYSERQEEILVEDAIWALMLGFEIKILDTNGKLIMDTEKALDALSPLMKRRVLAISKHRSMEGGGNYIPYPLYLGGKEVGRIDVRFLRPTKEALFIERANRFLLFSLLILGGLAVFLSIVASRKLTNPMKNLASAAKAISEGDLKSRVAIPGKDEISKLSGAFNRMAGALEKQESLRKKLTSNVAHELRTPISAVRAMLEGMMDGLIPTDEEQLQSLYKETGRLKNILESIEELSQAQASALTLRKESIELKPFLKNIIERFSKLFLDKGVSIQLECDDKFIVDADPDKLSQIIVNLMSNALKATEKGGSVRIKSGRKHAEVFIEVRDTGCGIKPEDIPFIFERFYKTAEGGLGIGLAIVKELVEAHSGRIEVKSEYGEGSTFTVYLPL